jgi:hypothetical protein
MNFILAGIANLQTFVSAAIAAIVSVSVVFLSRRSETKKHLETLRTIAYVDFVRAVASSAVLQKGRHGGPPASEEDFLKGNELGMLFADAKARIALYGSKSVVTALAKFLRAGPVLDSPERAKEFIAICQKMRNDTRPWPGKVTDHDAHFLLFSSDLENPLIGPNAGESSDPKKGNSQKRMVTNR